MIALLEDLGLACRERFYAGREAGWGAQVLEQEESQVVVFADVDLSAAEVCDDFAHAPLARQEHFGTVGLWCLLHGEAFFEPGLHHLECRFDFDAARTQFEQAGIRVMNPFTDLPYLRQAFTEGELWPVDAGRREAALAAGAITGNRPSSSAATASWAPTWRSSSATKATRASIRRASARSSAPPIRDVRLAAKFRPGQKTTSPSDRGPHRKDSNLGSIREGRG